MRLGLGLGLGLGFQGGVLCCRSSPNPNPNPNPFLFQESVRADLSITTNLKQLDLDGAGNKWHVHSFPTDEDGGFDLGCSKAVTGGLTLTLALALTLTLTLTVTLTLTLLLTLPLTPNP